MSQAEQLKDLRQLNSAGIKLALQKAGAIRNKAVKAYLSNQNIIDVKGILAEGYKDALVRGMKAAYLSGWGRVEKEAFKKSKTLQLSEMTDLERVLNRLGSPDDVKAIEAQLETRALQVIEGVTANIERKLRSTITDLIAEGTTTAQGKKQLAIAFDDLGLTPANSYTIENLFRTQTQLVYGAAKDHAEQSPEVQEILWGYKYVTVGDVRVRDSHKLMEGVVLEKDDPLLSSWYPPNGYSCRCQLIPLFDPPAGRIKKAPSGLPPVDAQFSFRPGNILPPPSTTSIVVPKPADKNAIDPRAYDKAKLDFELPRLGVKFSRHGKLRVNKPKSSEEARAQLAKVENLRNAATAQANALQTLPKDAPERQKAESQLIEATQAYEIAVKRLEDFF